MADSLCYSTVLLMPASLAAFHYSVSFFFSYSVTLYFSLKGRIKKIQLPPPEGEISGFRKLSPRSLYFISFISFLSGAGVAALAWAGPPPTGIMA